MRHIAELERMRTLAYREGKAYIDENPVVFPIFERLKGECPHVDKREIVSLFHLRNDEVIVATAHRLEYNATHRPGPVGPGGDR